MNLRERIPKLLERLKFHTSSCTKSQALTLIMPRGGRISKRTSSNVPSVESGPQIPPIKPKRGGRRGRFRRVDIASSSVLDVESIPHLPQTKPIRRGGRRGRVRVVRAGDFLVDENFDASSSDAIDDIPEVFVPDVSSNANNTSNTNLRPIEQYILSFGLKKVNFDERRQQRVTQKKNVARFLAHFGPPPIVVACIYKDLKERKALPSVKLEYILLTLNWFKLYPTEKVLSGRWGYCEDHIRCKVKEYGAAIQSLKVIKITFDGFDDDEIHLLTVDGVVGLFCRLLFAVVV